MQVKKSLNIKNTLIYIYSAQKCTVYFLVDLLGLLVVTVKFLLCALLISVLFLFLILRSRFSL